MVTALDNGPVSPALSGHSSLAFAPHSPTHAHAPPSGPAPRTHSSESLVLDISSPTAPHAPIESEGAAEPEPSTRPQPALAPAPPRLLGINYTPSPVEEQDEPLEEKAGAHPLHLNVHPPSPLPWERAHDDGASEYKKRPGPDEFPSHISSKRLEPPRSTYYYGPPPPDAAYGSDPIGQLGVHHPREVVRVERDYSGGEVVQFVPAYPLELEGRITPTQFLETINALNEVLISAYSLRRGALDNLLDIFSLHLSRLVLSTHYDREMRRLQRTIDDWNARVYAPAGLFIRWPRDVGFLFLEIEYY